MVKRKYKVGKFHLKKMKLTHMSKMRGDKFVKGAVIPKT